jgi:hypothetical protein
MSINRIIGSQYAANYSGNTLGRLDPSQVAEVLGFSTDDIPILVKNGLLEPLGKPAMNCSKYFARIEIVQLADDPKWLSKATNAIYQHWAGKSARRTKESVTQESAALN